MEDVVPEAEEEEMGDGWYGTEQKTNRFNLIFNLNCWLRAECQRRPRTSHHTIFIVAAAAVFV